MLLHQFIFCGEIEVTTQFNLAECHMEQLFTRSWGYAVYFTTMNEHTLFNVMEVIVPIRTVLLMTARML